MHLISIFCSAANAVCSNRWFILFNVLVLKVAMLTMILLLNKLGLGPVVDFSNTGARALPSAVHASYLFTSKVMQFEHMVSITVMLIFWWLFFLHQ